MNRQGALAFRAIAREQDLKPMLAQCGGEHAAERKVVIDDEARFRSTSAMRFSLWLFWSRFRQRSTDENACRSCAAHKRSLSTQCNTDLPACAPWHRPLERHAHE